MKIFIPVIVILFAESLQAQWSTDPNNNLIVGYGLNPDICSDSTGGCFITYEFGTTGYPRQLCVERLDKYGYKPWGDKKQIFGELPEQWYAEIIEDGEGGVIISYLDDLISGSDFIYRVRVQRVDSAGNLLWGQTGVRVTTTEINHGDQSIVSDGNGGCVVVWPNQLQNYTFDYRANRINNLGERAWSDTGIFLENSIYNDAASVVRASDGNYYIQTSTIYRINQNGQIINQYYANMMGQPLPDPEGGIVLTGIIGSIYNRRLVAQRKDSLGNNLWQEPYVEIADSIASGSFRIGENNRIINYAWLGRYDSKPYFQAINLEGNLIYQNKILLSDNTSSTTLIGIVSSYYNNTIFSWSVSGEINSIFAQMYDTLGNKLWNENGVIVSHPRITYQQYTTDGNGGFIIGGVTNNFTVVAQQVSKDGNLGQIVTDLDISKDESLPTEILLYQNYPNPFNPSTTINFSLPEAVNVKLTIYNTLGQTVAELVNSKLEAGQHSNQWDAKNYSSGIYFYELKTDKLISIKKMILIK